MLNFFFQIEIMGTVVTGRDVNVPTGSLWYSSVNTVRDFLNS